MAVSLNTGGFFMSEFMISDAALAMRMEELQEEQSADFAALLDGFDKAESKPEQLGAVGQKSEQKQSADSTAPVKNSEAAAAKPEDNTDDKIPELEEILKNVESIESEEEEDKTESAKEPTAEQMTFAALHAVEVDTGVSAEFKEIAASVTDNAKTGKVTEAGFEETLKETAEIQPIPVESKSQTEQADLLLPAEQEVPQTVRTEGAEVTVDNRFDTYVKSAVNEIPVQNAQEPDIAPVQTMADTQLQEQPVDTAAQTIVREDAEPVDIQAEKPEIPSVPEGINHPIREVDFNAGQSDNPEVIITEQRQLTDQPVIETAAADTNRAVNTESAAHIVVSEVETEASADVSVSGRQTAAVKVNVKAETSVRAYSEPEADVRTDSDLVSESESEGGLVSEINADSSDVSETAADIGAVSEAAVDIGAVSEAIADISAVPEAAGERKAPDEVKTDGRAAERAHVSDVNSADDEITHTVQNVGNTRAGDDNGAEESESGNGFELLEKAVTNGEISKPEARVITRGVPVKEEAEQPVQIVKSSGENEQEAMPRSGRNIRESRVTSVTEELEMLRNAKTKPVQTQEKPNVPAETQNLLNADTPITLTRANGERVEVRPSEVIEQATAKLVETAQTMKEQATEYSLVLNPEELGRIVVKMVKAADGAVSVTIAADNARTQRILEQHSAAMQENLRDSGIKLEGWQMVQESRQETYAQDYNGSSKNPYYREENHSHSEKEGEETSFADLIATM